MTTIVANRIAMAADTRATGGGPMMNMQKVFPVGHTLVGIAGEAFAAMAFIDWLLHPKKKAPDFKEDKDCFIAIQLAPNGLFIWNGWLVPIALKDETYAIGSGSSAALSRLRSGGTLQEAIEAAYGLDEGTGGHVEIHTLASINQKVKRGNKTTR